MRTRATLFLTTVSLWAVAVPGWAQATGGVEGGVNFANLSGVSGGSIAKTNPLTGVIAGAFVSVGHPVAFQAELLFSRKGAKLEGTDASGATQELLVKINYLEIPLLLKISPGSGKPAGAFLVAGPAVGIRLSAKRKEPGKPEEDFKNEVKSSDVGIAVGGGITVQHALLEARYTAGLRAIATDKAGHAIKNRVLSILAGVEF